MQRMYVGVLIACLGWGGVVGAKPPATPTTLPAGRSPGVVADKVAVTVDGHPIYVREIDAVYDAYIENSPRLRQMLGPRMRDQIWPRMRDRVIDAWLLAREAERVGVSITDAEVLADIEQEVQRKIIARGLTRQEFADDYFARNGTRLEVAMAEKVKDTAYRQRVLHEKLIEHKYPDKLTVTDAEIQERYDIAKEQVYRHPARVMARHILVAVAPDATPEAKAAARARVDEIAREVKEPGADFAAVAAARSDCPSGAKTGGNLGFFPRRGSVAEAIAAAAFALEPGQISDVVQSNDGFHIIQVMYKRPAMEIPLKTARPVVESTVRARKIQVQKSACVQELRNAAKIEYAKS